MKPDQYYIDKVRENVEIHIKAAAEKWDREGVRILDVAPNEHKGARQFFEKATIETLDINDGADYKVDLCNGNDYYNILKKMGRYDCIICTEVLEHTENPFFAVQTLAFLMDKKGEMYITTPFNLRIHNPLPDCWRFTEHGIRQLFKGCECEITAMETPDRELMPIAYRTIVRDLK